MLPLLTVSSPIAFDVLALLLSVQPRPRAVQSSFALLMQTTTEQITYLPSPRIPVSTCPYEADLPHPSPPTSHRLNVSHPRAKYLNLVHASQSPVSARIISKSRSRRSLLRSIYLAFLPRHRQMIPS